jgi:hypothetical protein
LGKFYDHLVHFSDFGITYQEKSGNPEVDLFGPSDEVVELLLYIK